MTATTPRHRTARSTAWTVAPRSPEAPATPPRSPCRTWRTRTWSAPVSPRDGSRASTPVPRRPRRACSPSSPTRTSRRSPNSRRSFPRSAARRRPARPSSRCRTTPSTTPASRWRSSSPTRSNAPSTPRTLSSVSYEEPPSTTTLDQGRDQAYEPETDLRRAGTGPPRARRRRKPGWPRRTCGSRGRITFAANHHNPIETLGCTTAEWDGGELTPVRRHPGHQRHADDRRPLLGIPMSKIRVIGQFVGGSFGSKAMVLAHSTLAAMAAREVGRPGQARPHPRADVHLLRAPRGAGAAAGDRRDERRPADRHPAPQAVRRRRHFDDWAEPSIGISSQIYACPNYEGVYRLFRANTMTPTFMRARARRPDVRARMRDGRARP